ncbi:MAG: hypothetical protein ABH877_01050, partial [bacterium]
IGPQKVAAMGMHLSHWVSTHGFALNLDPDLAAFSWIVPCGLRGRGVTSMRQQGGVPVSRSEVEREVVEEMARLFAREPHRLRPHELYELLTDEEGRSQGPVPAPASMRGVPIAPGPAPGIDNPGAGQGDSGWRGTACRV